MLGSPAAVADFYQNIVGVDSRAVARYILIAAAGALVDRMILSTTCIVRSFDLGINEAYSQTSSTVFWLGVLPANESSVNKPLSLNVIDHFSQLLGGRFPVGHGQAGGL